MPYKDQKVKLEHNKLYKRIWKKDNPHVVEKENLAFKLRYETDHEFRKKKQEAYKKWAKNNPRKRKLIDIKYRKSEKFKETRLLYLKIHPRPSSKYDPKTRLAMRLRRKFDKYTCQWQGCKSNKIEVHKIFPLSLYPEKLSHEIKNLISYCAFHHAIWHKHLGQKGAVILIEARIKK